MSTKEIAGMVEATKTIDAAKKPKFEAKELKYINEYMRTGCKATAYAAAGYKTTNRDGTRVKWLSQKVYKLSTRKKIDSEIKRRQAVMDELKDSQAVIGVEFVRAEHLRLKTVNELAGNMSEARLNLEAYGKTFSAYKEGGGAVTVDAIELTDRMLTDARKLSAMLIQTTTTTTLLTGNVAEAAVVPSEAAIAPRRLLGLSDLPPKSGFGRIGPTVERDNPYNDAIDVPCRNIIDIPPIEQESGDAESPTKPTKE